MWNQCRQVELRSTISFHVKHAQGPMWPIFLPATIQSMVHTFINHIDHFLPTTVSLCLCWRLLWFHSLRPHFLFSPLLNFSTTSSKFCFKAISFPSKITESNVFITDINQEIIEPASSPWHLESLLKECQKDKIHFKLPFVKRIKLIVELAQFHNLVFL